MASTSERVVECLESRQSFVVEAGAGSGKTRALVEALTHLLGSQARELLRDGQRIVCITYTNVAAREVMSRIDGDPLVVVSTIHDFLWSIIGRYQAELREAILAANLVVEPRKRIPDLDLSGLAITYWQYPRKWEKGKIHHDDVIALSAWMFENYPKLARLVVDQFPVIFVDEYQDAHASTVGLLLDVLVARDPERLTVGLFGDHMQKIYNSGVGKVDRLDLTVIQKRENYRCSTAVIDVLNKLRPELQQVAGGNNTPGTARFFYSESSEDDAVATLRTRLRAEGWLEHQEKVLMLTKRGIAADQKWAELYAVYQARGQLSAEDFSRGDDEFGELFASIEALVFSFQEGRFGDFLAIRGSGAGLIRRHSEKDAAVAVVATLNELRASGKIGDVLNFVWGEGLLRKPSRVNQLEERIRIADDPDRAAKDAAFLESLYEVPYAQVSNFESYLADKTPFTTQHGVKGEEYENVLVVLDDRLWNNYRFEAVLAGDENRSQYGRSLNLLYVSCSRAKRHLVVLATSAMSDSALDGARELFGEENFARL